MNGLGLTNFPMLKYNVAAGAAPPVPLSDLKSHIHRLEEVNSKLAQIADECLGLVGRLYGEGQTGKDHAEAPSSVGLSAEISEAISKTEMFAERIGVFMVRLSHFA